MDRTLEDTFYQCFTTRIFATGIPGTLAGTPVVSAYEDGSVTQITAGITLGVDHDSVTGLNLLTIVATAANGYESGKDYNLVITTGTVSSVSVVGEVVGTFSLGLSAAAVDLANATDGLGAIKAETAAILADTDLIDDGTSGLAKIATDVAAVLVDTGTTLDGKIDTIDGIVDSILVDTAEIGAAGAGLTDLGGMSAGMKAEVESEANDALVALKLDHLIASADGDDPVDGSIIADIVSATGDWSTFDASTDSLEALRVRGDAAWTTGGGGSAADIADAVWDEAAADHVTSTTMGAVVRDRVKSD